MTAPAAQLLPVLQSLGLQDRAELASVLIQSLDGNDIGDVAAFEDEWDNELKKRVEEVVSGEVQGIPSEEVFAKLAEKYS